MKLVVLATATDAAAQTEAEEVTRYAQLKTCLRHQGVNIETAFNLLGRHDYLLLMDVQGGPEAAFRAMSTIAQSGTMRTESFIAIPLESYFEIAADLASGEPTKGHERAVDCNSYRQANAEHGS